ncbi:hypothetical protein BBD42_30940 [Paenibacillus sp. BIHB 4019]|uniref:Uncharacterized protein n=1 Tax=Paenibacillus sp. BIHB 4019 TaxID=1870819 RepID=A0A1B2DRU2_9BACL|nr:hypothetical protein [Paenibacillus sp. BIHB 4019]ANY70421.1 hypothetical protein BBD42_30940 [Paenibacillus sp. BIHB 4019]
MEKVTLYKWININHTPGLTNEVGYSTEFCGSYGFMDCDEGAEYFIPEGFELSENLAGELKWYDAKGKPFELDIYKGKPVLEDSSSRFHFVICEEVTA